VKRIQLVYGGRTYTISNRDYDEVCAQIEELAGSGRPGWLEVNSGEGRPTTTRLLITPGSEIAVISDHIDAASDEADSPLFDVDERRPGEA
jgi:hypothetical protein